MKITIVAVGLRQPAWADSAVEDYLGRFPKDWNVTVKAVKPELRAGQSTANIMKTEAERIRSAIPHNSLIIAMDEHGKDLTTQDFAKKIRSWRDAIVFNDSASRHGACDACRTNLSGFQHSDQPSLSPSIRTHSHGRSAYSLPRIQKPPTA